MSANTPRTITYIAIIGNSDQTEGRGHSVVRERWATAESALERWGDGGAVTRDYGVMGVGSVGMKHVAVTITDDGTIEETKTLLFGYVDRDTWSGWTEAGEALRAATVTATEARRLAQLHEKFGEGPTPTYERSTADFEEVTFFEICDAVTSNFATHGWRIVPKGRFRDEASAREVFVPGSGHDGYGTGPTTKSMLRQVTWTVGANGSIAEDVEHMYGRVVVQDRPYRVTFEGAWVGGHGPMMVEEPVEDPEFAEYQALRAKVEGAIVR